MLIAWPSPLLEQDAKRRENCTPKETLQGSSLTSAHHPELVRHFIEAQVNSLMASQRDSVCPELPPWEDCENTSPLLCLASCQGHWRTSGIFQRAGFPLTNANPVKPKLFIRIFIPCFLTWGRKVLEILDSYTQIYTLLDLCMHISPILAYTSTILSLIFNEPDKYFPIVQWFLF